MPTPVDRIAKAEEVKPIGPASIVLAVIAHIIVFSLFFYAKGCSPKRIEAHMPSDAPMIANAVMAPQVDSVEEEPTIIEEEPEPEPEPLPEPEPEPVPEPDPEIAQKEIEKKLEEEKKIEEEKKAQEALRALEAEKLEEERKEKEEAERLQKEEEERKKKEEEARKKKEEEERRKREEEEKARIAEEERQRKIAAEKQAMERARANAQNDYSRMIAKIRNQWRTPPGVPPGLKAKIRMKLAPDGRVLSARVVESSGNQQFDRSAEAAVMRARQFRIPNDPKIYKALYSDFILIFDPYGRR